MESTSLVKALGLLEATAGQPAGRTLAALAAEVGLAKPTAHRILKSLTALGYLQRTATGVYRQTAQMNRLVSGEPHRHLQAVAEPILQQLHEQTQETVNLGVLRNGQIVYLQVLESQQPLRRVATPNSVDPFHTTALGRAIVSHLPEGQRQSLLSAAKLDRRTVHTNVDRAKLVRILDQAAHDGCAIEVDQTDLGVTCIGAPILEDGTALAAISLSVPTARADRDALAALVKAVRGAARAVSIQLQQPAAELPKTRSPKQRSKRPKATARARH
jgi:DNA-binding IclR family transcriptional regulator